jgi:hypothetical protein
LYRCYDEAAREAEEDKRRLMDEFKVTTEVGLVQVESSCDP